MRADELIQSVKDNEKFSIDIFPSGGDKPVNVNKEVSDTIYAIKTSGEETVTKYADIYAKLYPGYTPKIKKPDGGSYYHGSTLLSTVRSEYKNK